MNKFNSGAAGGRQQQDNNDDSNFMSDFFGDKIANDYSDERPIKAKGSYHVPNQQELQGLEEIEDVKYIVRDLKLNSYKNDILFIGGGITISSFAKYYKNNYGFNIYSSPLILIKDTINFLK